ncbi:hypothetical protein HYH03_008132 [Edaphochlamys debaryana]|uniref:Alpha-type protein kinase domain-containing protein n=1 Tax=Edaphochlamys debaryana TaxID=47281 RepID=A0A836BYH7_9CHLO|nr:hypothetical protein HYH03_008132 [Edaphochlamys debaryana]|eukprot:KAG2493615.1 hypothetical protein HYH03_008132 [Edaphochlamys debaryana]
MNASLLGAFAGLRVQGGYPGLDTSAITVVSHAHGRSRRAERDISKRDLQTAIKYGTRERANPGRDGKPRWRFTYQGVVYITDESCRHEITSWKLSDHPEGPPRAPAPEPFSAHGAGYGGGGAPAGMHVIVVVDASGSMRTGDVPGYPNRIRAVYDCVTKDLVEPQLKLQGGSAMQLSLIEMRDEAAVLFERYPLNHTIFNWIRDHGNTVRASSHGKYLPALDEAARLAAADRYSNTQVVLVFLSDGAPSDQGVSPEVRLERCADRVRSLGDLLGRDRVAVNTVAFGPPGEDYAVLQAMARALPRGHFQKLGLSATHLRAAFTSITSTITTLRTEAGGGSRLTPRPEIAMRGVRMAFSENDQLVHGRDWQIFVGHRLVARQRYDLDSGSMVKCKWPQYDMVDRWVRSYPDAQRGIAIRTYKFDEGAERAVFQCTQVVSIDGGASGYAVGPRLVAKQPRYAEHLRDDRFHRTFCRTHDEAESLAKLFNRRLQGPPAWQVHFLACVIYRLVDERGAWVRAGGTVDVLAEVELEGQLVKWNNNNGAVRGAETSATMGSKMGAIVEDDEDEEYDSEDEGDQYDSEDDGYGNVPLRSGGGGSRSAAAFKDEVPQAFSHFTWEVTAGQKLVCDLQGVWNASDGFQLTDPVIHHTACNKRNGATDKGSAGMASFFRTHTCNALCRRLGLRQNPVVYA